VKKLYALLLIAFVSACHPIPPPQPAPGPAVDGGVVVPAGWTSGARLVLRTLSWAVPAAKNVTDLLLPEPARTLVGRVFTAVTQAANDLQLALDAYIARGGDQCAAYSAVGGLHVALVQLAHALVDNGIAMGAVLEPVADTVASLLDNFVASCQPDAGWASHGEQWNAMLREITSVQYRHGRVLNHQLDLIHPPPAP